MSSIVVAGDTSGSVTISAPAVAGTPTLTLPTTSGTVVATSGGYVPTSQLASGSATSSTYLRGDQTWATISSGGMTLLGTLNTTSGVTQTLSGLNLTNYKNLFIVLYNVSWTASAYLVRNGTSIILSGASGAAGNSVYGFINVNLTNGVYFATSGASTTGATEFSDNNTIPYSGLVTWNTSTTSLSFSGNTGSFDSGTITVYGVA